MIRLAALLAFAFLAVPAVAEPSFPCNPPRSPVEAYICTDDDLTAKDVDVAAAYRALFLLRDLQGKDELAYQQEAWRYERDNCGGNYRCLEDAYARRLQFLNEAIASVSPAGGSGDFVMTANAGIAGYNKLSGENYTADECKELCRVVSWCKTVDYDPAKRMCYAQPVSRADAPDAWRTGVPLEHYEFTAR